MALKISANSLIENHYLVVESDGVKFVETALTGGKKFFRFSEIDCVMLSDDHLLSLQSGGQVYSIPTKPDDARHQEVISALIGGLQTAGTGWTGQTESGS